MSDAVLLRVTGHAARITLNRPEALNALSHQMCLEIEAALDLWASDNAVKLVIIDAAGDRAFCAGGDIAEMYQSGVAGDYAPARAFWRDEYRLNAKIFNYPKPYVAFMQGFTMGGGVGIGCHGSHRIVGDTSKLSMPECGIGLIPDVGGSLLLARAPGRIGEYLGTTGTRMGAADAIYAGFADTYLPETEWPGLIALLEASGDIGQIEANAPPSGALEGLLPEINRYFGGDTAQEILESLADGSGTFAEATLKILRRQSPVSTACTIELIHRSRANDQIKTALKAEFRFTSRAAEQGDFLEGVRAAIIDKDRSPKWRHADLESVSMAEVTSMLAPLGDDELDI
ncbi:MAG: enoyl-CoA hydratase/isomerase family protein [Paracoccaceae bacterium]